MKAGRTLLFLLAAQFAVVFIISLFLDSSQKVNSLMVGAFVSTINIVGLWVLWSVILTKKFVAPALVIVVFKYTILIILLAFWSDKIEDKLSFVVGVLTVPMALIPFSLTRVWRNQGAG